MKNELPPSPDTNWDVVRITPRYQAEYLSLCSSCQHNTGCTFQKDRQTPAFFCEEFEIDPVPLAQKAGIETLPSSLSRDVGDSDSRQFIGLCSNCANRENCVFPKPEGGIWHCEEYL